MAATTLLFVYGTLLRGEESHALMQGSHCVGEARSEARYELVDMGGYPALLEGGSDAVVGELYEVSDELLAQLDLFEEVPELYERKHIRLGTRDAECYVMRRERTGAAKRITSGDYRKR